MRICKCTKTKKKIRKTYRNMNVLKTKSFSKEIKIANIKIVNGVMVSHKTSTPKIQKSIKKSQNLR